MPKHKLIVALDVSDLAQSNELIAALSGCVEWFKVGKQLFTATGPACVKQVTDAGKQVFLDLKFHDIPNTVAGAVASATGIGATMINMHASGGLEMMRAARGAADEKAAQLGVPRPILLGVTVLTSINEPMFQKTFGSQRKMVDAVAYLAESAQQAGLDGVVASGQEIEVIRRTCGSDFIIVTPGVRPKWEATDDQKRVMAPGEAISAGANYIVVGRPITAAEDPALAAKTILQEMEVANHGT